MATVVNTGMQDVGGWSLCTITGLFSFVLELGGRVVRGPALEKKRHLGTPLLSLLHIAIGAGGEPS